MLKSFKNIVTIKNIIALIYGMIFLAILGSAYNKKLPGWFNNIPHYDIFGHFILYGIATYLGHLVFRTQKIHLFGYYLPLWPSLFTIFTIVEEAIQSQSIYRTFSFLDLTASIIGIISGYWLAEKLPPT
jgi:hypothetical protein